jgi:hypothetical protein
VISPFVGFAIPYQALVLEDDIWKIGFNLPENL